MNNPIATTPVGGSLKSVGSAGWTETPCAEGWWWDDDNRDWVEVSSGELSTAVADPDWRGLWYGPIIIPEKPNDKLSHGHPTTQKDTI